jgi:hypothetical protein
MRIFVPKNTYPSSKVREFVYMEVKHVRVKSTDLGPNHHLHNNKIKKDTYTLCGIFAHKISINILEIIPHTKFKSLRLSETPIPQAQSQELFSFGHVSA